MSHLRDGWDDDDDIVDEDGDETAGAGWNDNDEDLNFDDDDAPDASEPISNQRIGDRNVDDGWDDDDLNFNDHEEVDCGPVQRHQDIVAPLGPTRIPPPTPTRQQPTAPGRLYREVEAYILSLEQLGGSINALLEAEYNNPDKASELCAYYAERPGLVDYTIEKELPRMEYSVQDGPTVVTIKQDVARRLRHDRSLLPRCANQSLLADLLQVFTGHDLLVRPQYLATAYADACHFYLDLTNGLVQVQSRLTLSLPSELGRWEVAEILVSLTFVPSQQFIEYRLDKVHLKSTPETDPLWHQHLESAVELVSSINQDDTAPAVGEMVDMNFRDVFLQQSQNLLLNSADGMHSAWKDFEQVAGLRNKLKILPSFLPDHVVHAASEETMSPPQARPTSILGGLVRSGISRLAKQVALPEEDPSLYDGWIQQNQHDAQNQLQHHQQHQHQQQNRLDHRTIPTPIAAEKVIGGAHIVRQAPSTVSDPPDDEFAHEIVPVEEQSSEQFQSNDLPLQVLPRGAPAPREEVIEDGWGEEDDLFIGETDGADGPSSVAVPQFLVDEQRIPESWTYDPVTGIIPSRVRWTDPHPGKRVLHLS